MTKTLQPGTYFEIAFGWHISALVVELAVEYGYAAPIDWPEGAEALAVLEYEGVEAFETHCEEADCELLHCLYLEAERFLDDLTPEGYYAGYLPDWGDWGVYKLEGEE